jgi:hypothetical protein
VRASEAPQRQGAVRGLVHAACGLSGLSARLPAQLQDLVQSCLHGGGGGYGRTVPMMA